MTSMRARLRVREAIRTIRPPDTRTGRRVRLRCHRCGRFVAARAFFCQTCGSLLRVWSVWDQPLNAQSLDGPSLAPPDSIVPFGLRCARCAKRLAPHANYCPACGRLQPGSRWPREIRLPSGELSAQATVTRWQRRAMLLVGIAGLVALGRWPVEALIAGIALATFLYVAVLIYRLLMFRDALRDPAMIRISDAEALGLADDELPVYTILVPAYREPEVIGQLLEALDQMVYPKDRLDIRILLEEDDVETRLAAERARPGAHVTLVSIPPRGPRTKPKACNVGLAGARGDVVTIYDVEDRPDPLQLRRAVTAFLDLPPSVACLQARLSYHNAEQNLITRWFTAEYQQWFGQLLPSLVVRGAPLPLGGTSNHFRRDLLVAVGGWDPYNVTEDADLGIRLHRLGFRTRVLDSTTLEEANSDFVNWVKQRSRWYKGYLQTWLVHMRHPRTLWRDLGPRGFVGFNLFVGGTPAVVLINPIFWALTAIWLLGRPAWIELLFPGWLYYLGMASLVFGNAAVMYITMLSARTSGRPSLVLAAVLQPIYWVMMSIAAIKAFVQLVQAPSFWEKTAHGLDRSQRRHSDRAAA